MDGLLLIDKPAVITSFGVVRRVRKALQVKKVGHLGTLDPFATGLLPLALGEATKLTQFLLDEPKTYMATLKLGVETDTQDLTGRITAESDHLPAAEEVRHAAGSLVGEIDQVPPMYSAVHHQGERLYKLARRGEKVTAAPRKVMIYRLEIKDMALPQVTLEVECSKGTYIRTLAHDLLRGSSCRPHSPGRGALPVGGGRSPGRDRGNGSPRRCAPAPHPVGPLSARFEDGAGGAAGGLAAGPGPDPALAGAGADGGREGESGI